MESILGFIVLAFILFLGVALVAGIALFFMRRSLRPARKDGVTMMSGDDLDRLRTT